MTDQTTQVQDTTATPATAEPLPPELQYLKDHGEDVTELLKDYPTETPAAAPGTAPGSPAAEPAAQAPPAQQTPAADEPEPGEIVLDESGRARDARGKFVPKDAYARQRQRATTLEKENAELREKWARLEERWKQTNEILEAEDEPAGGKGKAPANPMEEPDVDPTVDIMGAIAQTQRRQKWQVEQHAKATQAATEQITQQGVAHAYDTDTRRFMSQQPDYAHAFAHVVKSRAAELMAFGIRDQAALTKQLREDEQQIVRQALAAGMSPAETFYRLAVAKGYTGPPTQAQPNGGQPRAPAQPAAPARTAAQDMVDAINRGQETGKTLTGAGGAAPPGLTVEQYINMPVDEIIAMKGTPQGRAALRAIGALA